jgi:hypothetical protein
MDARPIAAELGEAAQIGDDPVTIDARHAVSSSRAVRPARSRLQRDGERCAHGCIS